MARRPYNDPSSGVPKTRHDLIDRLVVRATLAAQASEPLEDVAANLATMAGANRAALELAQQRLEDRAELLPADRVARGRLRPWMPPWETANPTSKILRLGPPRPSSKRSGLVDSPELAFPHH
jgi:hypothetical protein